MLAIWDKQEEAASCDEELDEEEDVDEEEGMEIEVEEEVEEVVVEGGSGAIWDASIVEVESKRSSIFSNYTTGE